MPTQSLERVRDLFVFQTYTCLSYVDLESFDTSQINKTGVYTAKRGKTGVEFTFYVMKPARDILIKYDGKLPLISNEKYNDYLKLVAQAAKIDKPVTSHWARHTGATLLLNDGGVDMEIIARILGHTSTRQTRDTYAKLLDTTVATAIMARESKADIKVVDDGVIISNAEPQSRCVVYSSSGQQVVSTVIEDGSRKIPLQKGEVYILTINGRTLKFTL